MRCAPAGGTFLLDGLALDVSATGIRAALAATPDLATGDAAVGGLVPPVVLDYIRANRLYRS